MRSPSTLPIIPIPIPKLLGNLLNQLWMVQLERESHNSCGNEQLLFSFYCSDDWARKPYSLIELLLDDGFKLALKSVFSEIWVRTWVQVVSNPKKGLWLADISGLPISGLIFLQAARPLELMSWLRSQKKLTLVCMYVCKRIVKAKVLLHITGCLNCLISNLLMNFKEIH